MGEEKKKIWAWHMPSGEMYRIVSSPAEGTISVFDQNGTLVKKYETLSEEAVYMIEKNFLETVATMVSGERKETGLGGETRRETEENIAMYIR